MRQTIFVLCTLVLSISFAHPLWAEPQGLQKLALVPEYVYPVVRTNDRLQEVVLFGILDNNCFRSLKPLVKVDTQHRQVIILNQVQFSDTGWCTSKVEPYIHSVPLFDLEPGEYQIQFATKDGLKQRGDTLRVTPSKKPLPPVVYPEVKQVYREGDSLVIIGDAPAGYALDKPQVAIKDRRLIDVSITLRAVGEPWSPAVMRDFKISVPINESLDRDAVVHVRSMGGSFDGFLE